MTKLFDLSDRIFVVTGASSGIGRAMAGFLSEAGASVVLVARRRDVLEQTCDELGGEERAKAVDADLTDKHSIESVGQRCLTSFGRVDGVVNAAGINPRQPAEALTIDTWDQTLDLNLATPFFLSRCFVEDMRARNWGRIINIASLQTTRAFPNGLPYGASKAGVGQLTRAMSEAWSRDGIMANAIAPGFFPTDLTAAVFDDPDTRDWAANQTTIGRNGEMEDLRGPTLFLASDACNYVTGQILNVDGGFTAR